MMRSRVDLWAVVAGQVIPYDTEEEAVEIANDTIYGLNNAVASQDVDRALAIAGKLQSGNVMINGTDSSVRSTMPSLRDFDVHLA